MRFNCPVCKKTIDDAVIMHYVLRHPQELEAKASQTEIQSMLDMHYGVRRQRSLFDVGVDCVDSLLTSVELLVKFVTNTGR